MPEPRLFDVVRAWLPALPSLPSVKSLAPALNFARRTLAARSTAKGMSRTSEREDSESKAASTVSKERY